ncbi:glycine-rich RNA-binding protein 4, mitochondrial [Hordeum vulgare]|nr:glycine-rich RNA-binding protein 4, mitochondrial [Hordeum vulgare]
MEKEPTSNTFSRPVASPSLRGWSWIWENYGDGDLMGRCVADIYSGWEESVGWPLAVLDQKDGPFWEKIVLREKRSNVIGQPRAWAARTALGEEEYVFAGPGFRPIRSTQIGLTLFVNRHKRKPFRRSIRPFLAPLSPPTHRDMAAVAARAGAARVGFRRMFSVSAFAPPPPPTARPAAEPCNNLFVSGNSSSRVSLLSPYFSAVKSSALFLLLCPGFEARAKPSYLWCDTWDCGKLSPSG